MYKECLVECTSPKGTSSIYLWSSGTSLFFLIRFFFFFFNVEVCYLPYYCFPRFSVVGQSGGCSELPTASTPEEQQICSFCWIMWLGSELWTGRAFRAGRKIRGLTMQKKRCDCANTSSSWFWIKNDIPLAGGEGREGKKERRKKAFQTLRSSNETLSGMKGHKVYSDLVAESWLEMDFSYSVY